MHIWTQGLQTCTADINSHVNGNCPFIASSGIQTDGLHAFAGADHEGQALNANTTNAPARTGGRRYSAMTGRLAEDPSAASVAANA